MKSLNPVKIDNNLERKVNKNNKTVVYTGDVKKLIEEYKYLKNLCEELELENSKLKSNLENNSKHIEDISMEAFVKYLRVENPEYYKALKVLNKPNNSTDFLELFGDGRPSKEDEVNYELYNIKKRKFNNILNNLIEEKYGLWSSIFFEKK